MKLASFVAISSILSLSSTDGFSTHNGRQSRASPLLHATEAAVDEALNPRLSGLALMLDDGTRKSHSMAQNSQFVTGFFKGLADKESYRSMLTGLYFVYDSMEREMDDTSEDRVQALDKPALRRLSSLKEDMEYFYGGDWESQIEPSTATKAYVARVQEISKDKPYLMIAHQYTRYLGDLFGGQMMGGMASRSLNLENGDGTAFYTFDSIPSNKDFITDWYQSLNDLDLTDEQKVSIVDEANLVFDLNIGLLQELEGSPLKAMWILAINSLKKKFA